MAVIRRQQVLPTFVAVGIGVSFGTVGGGQQVARCVVGEGIGRGAVGGSGELAESIVGIGPGFPAGGFLGDIARRVVGKLAGQPGFPTISSTLVRPVFQVRRYNVGFSSTTKSTQAWKKFSLSMNSGHKWMPEKALISSIST